MSGILCRFWFEVIPSASLTEKEVRFPNNRKNSIQLHRITCTHGGRSKCDLLINMYAYLHLTAGKFCSTYLYVLDVWLDNFIPVYHFERCFIVSRCKLVGKIFAAGEFRVLMCFYGTARKPFCSWHNLEELAMMSANFSTPIYHSNKFSLS